MNLVVLIGNLGKDPELTYTQSGTAKCKFSLATSKTRTDNAGEKQEQTFWHNVVVWGKQAESCGKYLAKGRKVCVVGEVETRSYEQDGQTKWITEINAQRVEFLGGDRGERGAYEGQDGGGQRPQTPRGGNRSPVPAKSPADLPTQIDDDDSIPF